MGLIKFIKGYSLALRLPRVLKLIKPTKKRKGKKSFSSLLNIHFDTVQDGLMSNDKTSKGIQSLLVFVGVSVALLRCIVKDTPEEVEIPKFQPTFDVLPQTPPKVEFSTSIGTSFEQYAPKLSGFEGGWSDHKADKGGKTYRGVTLKTYQAFFGKDKTAEDLKKLTDAQWDYIMRSYWAECRADEMINQSVAEIIVDWAINSGPVTAIKEVQKILDITPTGHMGSRTIDAINSVSQQQLFHAIKNARIRFYRRLVMKDPSQKEFLEGWINRVNSLAFVDQDTSWYLAESMDKTYSAIYENIGSGQVNRQ